jgi:hypothetical protein
MYSYPLHASDASQISEQGCHLLNTMLSSLFKVKEMDDLQVVKAVMKSAFDIKVKGSTGNLRRKGFTSQSSTTTN